MSERQTGTVKWFDSAKGSDFIEREAGKDLFFFRSIVGEGHCDLTECEKVEFSESAGQKGPQAELSCSCSLLY
ncbi:MAG: cold shock domain-containing protein [Candidatus Thiodiazotropha lotti]|nr:cold shock domain-containing protein [Candidatus Thiodiazotropha lotti]MCG7998683.1 cold shock domain-containing protein [Candidatus Thiodiazotropha lotti]MCW4183836.1 cold shock domain-containing protein [Candidatus Thiodiazotropha weberae]MCW4190449.1 cold shock domain-containing protein [Candidatus Thiodiazotropha weberae]